MSDMPKRLFASVLPRFIDGRTVYQSLPYQQVSPYDQAYIRADIHGEIYAALLAENQRLRGLVKDAYIEGALDMGLFTEDTAKEADERFPGSDVARWMDDADAQENDLAALQEEG